MERKELWKIWKTTQATYRYGGRFNINIWDQKTNEIGAEGTFKI